MKMTKRGSTPALVRSIADGVLSVQEMADRLGLTKGQVTGVLQRNPDIPRPPRGRLSPAWQAYREDRERRVAAASDGLRTRAEVAALTGLTVPQVQKVLSLRPDIPRPTEGSQPGSRNHQFRTGRRVDKNGYAWVTVPEGTPNAVKRSGRERVWLMQEHRLVMQQKLGRPLRDGETVDHIDGLTLHNAPENLRLFVSNAAHLQATLSGQVPAWSEAGLENMQRRCASEPVDKRVNTHGRRRKRGDVRLRQILLLALSLGPDSPYLLGTHPHTKKAGIDLSSRSTIERALADLSD